jgi:hypothetical protein
MSWSHGTVTLQTEVEQVTTANLQITTVERGVIECRIGFEILLEAFVHAEQGTFQPHFVTAKRIRAALTSQLPSGLEQGTFQPHFVTAKRIRAALTSQLPSGLDYPNFPFSELQRIVVPHMSMLMDHFFCMYWTYPFSSRRFIICTKFYLILYLDKIFLFSLIQQRNTSLWMPSRSNLVR